MLLDTRNKKHIVFLIVLALFFTLFFSRRLTNLVVRQSPSTALDLFAYTQRLVIHGIIDPPCTRTRNVYVCSGYCPWSNTYNFELVSCNFLPRIPHQDFTKHNVYCKPEPDNCPTYNAWLKDHLPETRVHITQIPKDLLSNFTLNYSIPVDSSFQEFRSAEVIPRDWTEDSVRKYREQLRARGAYGSYINHDIYPALDKYASLAVIGKKCAVIGSENPWIEAALLEYNASHVTTFEYGTIQSSVARLFTITPMAYAKAQENNPGQRELFDSIWSYSSLEHDGLGRYRDPLNPYGDLQSMAKLTCILKPGGLVFLGVPLNIRDSLDFNLHRIYGGIRLPLLYRNYHIVEFLGKEMLTGAGEYSAQHFVVLQNKLGCKQP